MNAVDETIRIYGNIFLVRQSSLSLFAMQEINESETIQTNTR